MTHKNPFLVAKSSRGLTLIELMVALVMGLILLGGLATVFIANKQTYRHQDVLARLQENGRFALALLERDIRGAGGGVNIDASLAQNDISLPGVKSGDEDCGLPSASPFGGLIEGFDGDLDRERIAELGLPTGASAPLRNSDVIRVTTSTELGVEILKDPGNPGANNPAARLDVSNCGVLEKINAANPGSVFTVVNKDGTAYSIFQMTEVSVCGNDGTGNLLIRKNNLIGSSGVWNCDFVLKEDFTGGYLLGTKSIVYFVAKTGRTDSAGQSIPALFRAVNRGAAEELVEGVESMRLMFGTGNDRVVETYGRPNTIWDIMGEAEWANVRSVRLQLLLHSIQPNALPEANPTNFAPGADYYAATDNVYADGSSDAGWTATPPDDGRWRQVYSTTVALRNRLP